jgi:3-hydroxy acid dehydrogenase/malonic semialdehyde reductase
LHPLGPSVRDAEARAVPVSAPGWTGRPDHWRQASRRPALLRRPAPPPPRSLAAPSRRSSGIGEAVAWRLAAEGAALVLIARRAERLATLRAELEADGARVHVVALDVCDGAAVAALPAALPPAFADVSILVNNAGLALGTATCDALEPADAAAMISTNVQAVVNFTRAFVPAMRARDAGHVVNVSSVAAHEAYAGGSVYCATKAAVDALTKAARHDLLATKVRVSAVSPGAVETEFSVVRFGGDRAAAAAVYAGMVPLTAADVAEDVAYILTRPAHVQIAEVVSFATYQSGAKAIARPLAA